MNLRRLCVITLLCNRDCHSRQFLQNINDILGYPFITLQYNMGVIHWAYPICVHSLLRHILCPFSVHNYLKSHFCPDLVSYSLALRVRHRARPSALAHHAVSFSSLQLLGFTREAPPPQGQIKPPEGAQKSPTSPPLRW